jgi:guanosine-3',5'-bis(diphosphate) 3'-pyrophosphohydrolase
VTERRATGLALVSLAADFAARRHAGQKRKGKAQEPYVNHLAEVAHLLASTAGKPDPVLLAAAWLHDTVEDTETQREEIEALFGEDVASTVIEVTDDKTLPKARRKELQVEKTPHKSDRAKLIKLADKTSNLRSLAASPPEWWDRDRVLAYVEWAEKVVATCLPLNDRLAKEFRSAAEVVRRHAGAAPTSTGA